MRIVKSGLKLSNGKTVNAFNKNGTISKRFINIVKKEKPAQINKIVSKFDIPVNDIINKVDTDKIVFDPRSFKFYDKKYYLRRNKDTEVIDGIAFNVAQTKRVVKRVSGADLGHYWLLLQILRTNHLSGNLNIKLNDDNGNNIIERDVNVPAGNTALNRWWKDNAYIFHVDSEYTAWQIPTGIDEFGNRLWEPITFIIDSVNIVRRNPRAQNFRDGISHCLLNPIYEWAKSKAAESKGTTQKKYNAIVSKLVGKKSKEGYLSIYKNGVPENKVIDLCNDLCISIDIYQPFLSKKFLECKPEKKSLKKFVFTNTRFNHVESNVLDGIFITDRENAKVVEFPELLNIIEQLKEQGKEYIFIKTDGVVSCIKTCEGMYIAKNDFMDKVEQFEKKYNIKNCSFDGIKYPKLLKFINNGTHFNLTVDFDEIDESMITDDNVKHIDMTKAYTKFKECKYYNGFLGKITDFRKVDEFDFSVNGYYRVEKFDFSGCSDKFVKLNKKLAWFADYNIYTNVELKAVSDLGATFNVTHGAYGLRLDFDFDECMIKNKVPLKFGDKSEVVPYYSKWTGQIASVNDKFRVFMHTDRDFAESLRTENNVYFNDHTGEATIEIEKKRMKVNRHIAGFITAYQRLNVLEQLMKMDIDLLIRVCVDGIYFYNHDCEIGELFGDKGQCKKLGNAACDSYLSSLNVYDDVLYLPKAEPRKHYIKNLYKGAGGNGKTHYHMVDRGLIHPVYIVPTYEVLSAKKKEYKKSGFDFVVLSKLLYSANSFELLKRWNVAVLDECSMYSEKQKRTLFNKFMGKMMFCGDLGFQLPPVEGEEMTEEGFDNVVEFHKNYRFKCDKLKKKIAELRDIISRNGRIYDNFYNDFEKVTNEEIKNIYDKNDYILCSEHVFKDEYTEMFSDIEKYRIKENKGEYCNGQISFKKIDGLNMVLQHGFTIHSVQGKTCESKLIIDIRKMKNTRMLYTAISRARYLDQIKIRV